MSDISNLYSYFQETHQIKKSSKNWWIFSCPFCDRNRLKKKCAVRFDWNRVKCWSCNYSATVLGFVLDLESLDYKSVHNFLTGYTQHKFKLEASEEVQPYSKITLPVGFKNILDGDSLLGNKARKYLRKRGFNIEHLSKMGFGYSDEHDTNDEPLDYFGYIIIPFKIKGILQYYIGRDFIGNFLRYKNPPAEMFEVSRKDIFFNEDALSICKEVDIVEGWADAMTMGNTGISVQGSIFSDTQTNKLINARCDNYVFIPDSGVDGKGETFYQKTIQYVLDFLIEHKNVKVVNLNITKREGKDINELGKHYIDYLKHQTPYLTFSSAMQILMI